MLFGEDPCNRSFAVVASAVGVAAEGQGAFISERSVQLARALGARIELPEARRP